MIQRVAETRGKSKSNLEERYKFRPAGMGASEINIICLYLKIWQLVNHC